ncbi:hypothetical protein D3C76_1493910 [compost metagenome]
METHVETNTYDQHARQVWRSTSNGAQPRPAVGRLFSANSRSSTHSHQSNRQANTEAQYEHAPERDFFNLKT